MDKAKTSKEHKKSLENLAKLPHSGIKKSNSEAYLLNEDNVARGILECLNNNDPEGVIEVIQIYLEALNKTQFLKDADLPRSTVYTVFKSKNPTLRTLAKLMHTRRKKSFAS